MFAMAAARALRKHTELTAKEIAQESLQIASEICITLISIIVEDFNLAIYLGANKTGDGETKSGRSDTAADR